MDQRAQYLIQVMEKIGAPLMNGLAGKTPASGNEQDTAQTIAELLSACVKFGIDIGNMIDINNAGPEGDDLRIALTALSSPLIAHYYKEAGRVPSEGDSKKMIAALQAVMTFSENFAPDHDNTQRLENISVKALETNIHYIDALTPAINAIASFAFGQSETKLLLDISTKLTQNASSLRKALLGESLPDADKKTAELALLRTLSRLYADCHNSEVAKVMALNEEERINASISVETVWSAFETRSAMLQALAENLVPNGSAATGAGAAPAAPAEPDSPPPQSPDETPAQAPKTEVPPPQTTQNQPATPAPEQKAPPPQDAKTNPMSMFAKPKTTEAPPSETPPAAPPTETPPPETPATPPPAETPPEEPPSTTPEENSEKPADKPAGSPMSFFKSKPKKDENND